MTLVSFTNLEPRVLLLSLRKIQNFTFNSCLYEFEDIIAEVDMADILSPSQYTLQGNIIKKILRHEGKIFNRLINCNPCSNAFVIEKEYDLLMFIIDFPWNILTLNYLKSWRNKCKIACCYLVELWDCDIEKYKHFIEFLNHFDFIFLGHSQIVDRVSDITNTPCKYLAPGVNTLKFCPTEINKDRMIDLCSLGRRSPVTHQYLLQLAETHNFFYYFDNINIGESRNDLYQEHRTFIANLLKNSRYFLTNYAKVNLPEQTKKQIEIGYRFFEGAAAGTVMIGSPPYNNVYHQYFDWKDAVIPMNFHETNIFRLLADLDAQPQRLAEIRHQNIINSLLRHDWVYRWQEILATIGLDSTPQMRKRQRHLQQFAQSFKSKYY